MCSDESVVILLLNENRGSCTIFIFFNILTNHQFSYQIFFALSYNLSL